MASYQHRHHGTGGKSSIGDILGEWADGTTRRAAAAATPCLLWTTTQLSHLPTPSTRRAYERTAPAHGIREQQARRGVQPRDHARENRMAIREQQLRNRERKHEEVAQAQQPFKMQQFR